jgi:hypothetical protein
MPLGFESHYPHRLSGPKRARSHYCGPFCVVPGRKHYLGGKTTGTKSYHTRLFRKRSGGMCPLTVDSGEGFAFSHPRTEG